jgi:hypothetical protein
MYIRFYTALLILMNADHVERGCCYGLAMVWPHFDRQCVIAYHTPASASVDTLPLSSGN